MTTVGDDVLLFGGYSASSVKLNDLWKWDQTAGNWVELMASNPPPARSQHGAATSGGNLYVGFGYGTGLPTNDFWVYDVPSNAWTEVAITGDVPNGLAYGGVAGLSDGRIFVGGGYDETWMNSDEAYILTPTAKANVVLSQRIANLPTPIYGFQSGSTAGGAPIIMGGYTEAKDFSNEIYIWEPEPAPLGRWVATIPKGEAVLGRVLAGTAQIVDRNKIHRWGKQIVVLGGESRDKAWATSDTQIYDVDDNAWSYEDRAPIAVSSNAIAILPPGPGNPSETLQIIGFGGRNLEGETIDTMIAYNSELGIDDTVTQYITAAAHASGVGGTNWVTDLEAHNRGAETSTCTLALFEKGVANTDPMTTEFSVPPGTSLRLEDVLLNRFGFEGTGALRIVSNEGQLLVTSRTYNRLGPGNPLNLPTGATFGQFIPAVSSQAALENGDEARLIQLSGSADPASGFRTNIGFVNITAEAITIEVDVYSGDGSPLGTLTENIAASSYSQINGIFDKLNAGTINDGFAIVSTTTAGARYFTYASVVDNPTGDPIYIVAQPAIDFSLRGGFITASAHAAGLGGTQWRTDMVAHNPTGVRIRGTMVLLERDVANTNAISTNLAIEPGQSVAYADVLDTIFGFEGAAALHFQQSLAGLVITSRTFNLLGDGNDYGFPEGSTFGQFIPAVSASTAADSSDEVLLIQLSRSADTTRGFRTNIGFLNTTEIEIEVVVDLYDAQGNLLGSLTRTLGEFESHQITDAYKKINANEVTDGFAIVTTLTPGGRFLAYASVVDNITGDPIYIPGMP